MACFHPITGYRTSDGEVTLDRKRGYVDRTVSVACGSCTGCRLARAHAWALRCVHEAQLVEESSTDSYGVAHRSSSFITLTYRDEAVPRGQSLNVRDWQLFAKRLRKRLGAFRFYMCGEYGEEHLRPHYHALLFGHDFRSSRIAIGTNEFGDTKYWSDVLESIWGLGRTELGTISWRSAAYVAGYINTKQGGRAGDRRYRRNDGEREWYVKPEFSLMSRRPGLGKPWFDKYGTDAFPSDFVVHNGRRRRVPRFYDSLLESTNPDMLEVIKHERVKRALSNTADLTVDRLRAREERLILGRKRKGF